jgi:hypothetical protein
VTINNPSEHYRLRVLACLKQGGCVWCNEQAKRWADAGTPLGIETTPQKQFGRPGKGSKRTNNHGALGVNTYRW